MPVIMVPSNSCDEMVSIELAQCNFKETKAEQVACVQQVYDAHHWTPTQVASVMVPVALILGLVMCYLWRTI